MKTLIRFFQFAVLFVILIAGLGTFFFVFSAVAPASDSGSLLKTNSPLPTPASVQDTPLYLFLQQHQSELTTPANSDATPLAFSILAGELPADVARRLQGQGLISDADLFVQYIKYLKIDQKIQAGEYVLRRTMTMSEIADALQRGRAKSITLTIRPGWRAEEIADYLGTLGLTAYNRDEFLRAVQSGKFDYAFLRDRPKGASTTIEGYLLPETYNVPVDTPANTLITVVLNTFDKRVDEKTRQQVAAQKMTLHEIVTLASIVEREAVVASERSIIASVYLNRVKKKMLLQADATAQYALGYQPATRQWWKSPVTIEELAGANSPYNTYRNLGLPPAPIANPSAATIAAAAQPAQTEYLYYYSKGDGTHAFAKTYEEHLQNQQKYGK